MKCFKGKKPGQIRVLNPQPPDPDSLICSAPSPSLQDLVIFMPSHGWALSCGPGGPTSGQALWNLILIFPEPLDLEKEAVRQLDLPAPTMEPRFAFCQQHLESPIQVLSRPNAA